MRRDQRIIAARAKLRSSARAAKAFRDRLDYAVQWIGKSDLARRTKLTRQTIDNLLAGKTQPSELTLTKLCDAFRRDVKRRRPEFWAGE